MKPECAVEDCRSKVSARGYCGKHYYRLRSYGSADLTRRSPHGKSLIRDEEGRKLCTRCAEWLPVSRFGGHPDTMDRLDSACEKCKAFANRFRRYGVDLDWFNATLEEQGGVCGVCKTTRILEPNQACVDHDHTCCADGRGCLNCVRGILCRKCNLMLGHADDSIQNLLNAIDYLRKYMN